MKMAATVSAANVGFTLTNALLIYNGQEQGSPDFGSLMEHPGDAGAYATWHSVKQDRVGSTGPQIQPGRLVTPKQLNDLVDALRKGQQLGGCQWVTDKVIAVGGGRTIWWTPPSRVPMFFSVNANYSEDGKTALNRQAALAVPGFVWMLHEKTLHIWATKATAKPQRDEQLYQAPIMNVWSTGVVCWGTTPRIEGDEETDPQAWERAIWQSHFTHPNFREKDRMIKGMCPVKFWAKQVKKPSADFDLKRLAPVGGKEPLLLSDLVSAQWQQRLKQVPRAQGEF